MMIVVESNYHIVSVGSKEIDFCALNFVLTHSLTQVHIVHIIVLICLFRTFNFIPVHPKNEIFPLQILLALQYILFHHDSIDYRIIPFKNYIINLQSTI